MISSVSSRAGQKGDGAALAAEITKRSGSSFYWAMRVLPRLQREGMFAVYAFCREVDDIADEPGAPEEKSQRLTQWRRNIEQLYDGGALNLIAQNSISLALQDPITRFGLRREDFLAVIEGMEMDAGPTLEIEDMAGLERYCDRVAGAVGRLSNRIFGVEEEAGLALATSLGQALQLTNILRDIAVDAAVGRIYLPRDLLARHGISNPAAAHLANHPGLAGACEELAGLARRRFAEAETDLRRCDRQKVRSARIMKEVYHRILDRLCKRGWRDVGTPVRVSKLEKLWIALRHGVF